LATVDVGVVVGVVGVTNARNGVVGRLFDCRWSNRVKQLGTLTNDTSIVIRSCQVAVVIVVAASIVAAVVMIIIRIALMILIMNIRLVCHQTFRNWPQTLHTVHIMRIRNFNKDGKKSWTLGHFEFGSRDQTINR